MSRIPGAFYYDSMVDDTQTLQNRSCLTQVINYLKVGQQKVTLCHID
jgi:hypothetical protein